jgi:hypothetical protein
MIWNNKSILWYETIPAYLRICVKYLFIVVMINSYNMQEFGYIAQHSWVGLSKICNPVLWACTI